jgi:hydrogenase-1 operon protein HyaF
MSQPKESWNQHIEISESLIVFLQKVEAALVRVAGEPLQIETFDLADRPVEERRRLVSILGEGEISGILRPSRKDEGKTSYIRESVYPGIWLVGDRPEGGDVGIILSRIEIGRAPEALIHPPRSSSLLEAGGLLPDDPVGETLLPGLMNALPLLQEAAHHLNVYDPKKKNHRIFLNKLPLSEADAQWIDLACSLGHVDLRSKGYGDCQVHSTTFSGLWRVLYKNPEGIPLLDALCVADIPDEVAAAPEDLSQSLTDFREFLNWVIRDLS